MCTNKRLYSPGNLEFKLGKRAKKTEKMSFQQIAFMTDCLRLLGNRLDMPIVEVSALLSAKSVYPLFYNMVKKQPELSRIQVTNRLQKMIAKK